MNNFVQKIISKDVLAPVIILFSCMLLCAISKKIILKIFNIRNKNIDIKKHHTIVNLINNLVRTFIITIAFILILECFGIDTATFVASLGVFSLVIGLAVQDVLKDFISGIYMIFEGQYSIGDWVKIGDFKGEVLASNFRTTKLKAYTGEIKIISNRNITELINYSLSKTTSIIDVSVAYESDLKHVRNVLDDLCIKLKDNNYVNEIECLGVQELEECGITFRIIANADYSNYLSLTRIIKEQIVIAFNENDIVIPYPQVVVRSAKRL